MNELDISLADLDQINFPFGTVYSVEKTVGGYSNNNYLIKSSTGMYRVRVPKYFSELDKILIEQELLNWVAQRSNLPIPLLHIQSLTSKTHINVFPYIDADLDFNVCDEHLIFHAGKALSEFHQAIIGYKEDLPAKYHISCFDIVAIRKLIDKHPEINNNEIISSLNHLHSQILSVHKQLNSEPYSSLPFIWCHGDYAPANLLSKDNQVIGIIDFENCRWAPRIYDVAIALLALEQTEGYKQSILIAFMDGYNSNITLSKIELVLIPAFKKLRSLESANRHFQMVITDEIKINPDLINYWACITKE